jgi:hypothetical protein
MFNLTAPEGGYEVRVTDREVKVFSVRMIREPTLLRTFELTVPLRVQVHRMPELGWTLEVCGEVFPHLPGRERAVLLGGVGSYRFEPRLNPQF